VIDEPAAHRACERGICSRGRICLMGVHDVANLVEELFMLGLVEGVFVIGMLL
jgi:hypothetical protein